MRKSLGIGAAAVAMAVAGCQPHQPSPQTTASRSVLDVQPSRTARHGYDSPQRVTPPDEPTVAAVIAPVTTTTPDTATPAKHWSSSKHPAVAIGAEQVAAYKVKKGDTLYRIAKSQYGDGKKWTQIASANPGLSPQSLKIGQTIVVP